MGNNVLYICVCGPRLAYRNSNWTGSKLCFRCRAVFSVRGLLNGARIGPSRNLVVGAELCFRSGVCLTELELDRLEIWFPVQICVFCPGLLTGAGIWPVGAELCFRSGVCFIGRRPSACKRGLAKWCLQGRLKGPTNNSEGRRPIIQNASHCSFLLKHAS